MIFKGNQVRDVEDFISDLAIAIGNNEFEKITQIPDDLMEAYRSPKAYFFRCMAFNSLENYNAAIEDARRAQVLDPYNAFFYLLESGPAMLSLNYLAVANSLTMCLKYTKEDKELALSGRAHAYTFLWQFKKALSDYKKLIQLNPKEEDYKAAFRLLSKLVKLSGSRKQEIASYAIEVDFIINKIMGKVVAPVIENIVHYTTLKVADLLVFPKEKKDNLSSISQKAESYFRFYNVSFMNDPEEGEVLMDYMDDSDVKEAFTEGKLSEENNVYLGSFLPAPHGILSHEDDLVMWRTYGKNEEGKEAQGCSIIISDEMFDRLGETRLVMTFQDSLYGGHQKKTSITGEVLLQVIYINNKTKQLIVPNHGDVDNVSEKLKESLSDLSKNLTKLVSYKKIRDRFSANNDAIINEIVYSALSEIRYLFKSADYAFENELRVIQYVPPESDRVQIDDNEGVCLPRRLFIESSKPIRPYLNKVILGPKVAHPSRWKYLEVQMKKNGYNIEVVPSKCKYQ